MTFPSESGIFVARWQNFLQGGEETGLTLMVTARYIGEVMSLFAAMPPCYAASYCPTRYCIGAVHFDTSA